MRRQRMIRNALLILAAVVLSVLDHLYCYPRWRGERTFTAKRVMARD